MKTKHYIDFLQLFEQELFFLAAHSLYLQMNWRIFRMQV